METVIFNNGQNICWDVVVADTFWLRLRGLLGRKKLYRGQGLLLKPCNQIHTWLMTFAIDVVYLDDKGRILNLEHRMVPWCIGASVDKCTQVLELPAGAIGELALKIGDFLDIIQT